MKRLSDNFLTMLLPLTMVAATAFSMVAVIAFRMEATTAGFVFFTLSTIGWIGLIAGYRFVPATVIFVFQVYISCFRLIEKVRGF